MTWQQTFRNKHRSIERAFDGLPQNARVYMGGNAATPRILAKALGKRAMNLPGISVEHVLLLGDDPLAEARAQGHVRHRAWFVGPADRDAVNAGRADYIPCHLSDIPGLIRDDVPGLNAAILMVSPPDHHGFMSLGVEVLGSLAAAENANEVYVQINPEMPRVHGNTFIHVDQVDHIIEGQEALVEVPPQPATAVEQAIASHLAPLIPEGATLQLGIGGVPNALLECLQSRDDLGIHTEMVADGVMHGVESGFLTGRMKTLHPRKVVTTFAMGTRDLYDWVHNNPRVEAYPCDYTNNPIIAAQNRNLVAINSAISVDLTGQVNSDSIGTRIYSGVGGQVDFIRAASLCKNGLPVIALPSTCKGGTISRIVSQLAPGAGVVTSRADVHMVVTEHGVAHLHGRSLRERAEALIQIAHPDHRDELTQQAKERNLIR